MAQRTLRQSTMKIKAETAQEITIKIGEGNITWTEKQSVEYTLNAGILPSSGGGAARLGDDQPIDVSFDILWEYYKSSGAEAATPVEALQNIGAASSWTTTDTVDPCAPYAVDIEIKYDPTCTTGVTNPIETTTLPIFRWEQLSYDISAGQISCSGTCQALVATSVRSA